MQMLPEVPSEAGAERPLQLIDGCLLDPANRSKTAEQRASPARSDAGNGQELS